MKILNDICSKTKAFMALDDNETWTQPDIPEACDELENNITPEDHIADEKCDNEVEKEEANSSIDEKPNNTEKVPDEENELPEEEPKPPDYTLDDVISSMAAVAAGLSSIDENIRDLSERHAESNAQAQTLKMMSTRIKEYEDQFVAESILKPILNDLILLSDSISNSQSWLNKCDDQEDWKKTICEILDSLEKELHSTMSRYDLTPISNTGDTLDPSIHKVVRVNRKEAARDVEIAERLRKGWIWKNQVMRHEELVINRYTTERTA